MDEIVKEFLIECNELIEGMDRDLVELEKAPTSKPLLSQVFRAIHTIKGTSGTLGFPRLEQLAHSGENLLSLLREGRLLLNAEIATALLASSDLIRGLLRKIEETGLEGDAETSQVIAELDHLAECSRREVASGARTGAMSGEQPTGGVSLPFKDAGRPEVFNPPPVGPVLAEEARRPVPPLDETKAPQVSNSTIRVDVRLLDKLMDLVGELVLARNQILQLTSRIGDADFLRTAQRLKILTSELQEGITKTRMQPIETIWKKIPRLVRDVANNCDKRVSVEMEGAETELDRTILEAISDPLVHILRNAIDHGIEAPAARQGLGKPPEGRIFLRAYHEGGQVNIEISDDGRGVSVDRVKQKALENGIITAAQAMRLSDQEALNLVFLPGISTAQQVTNISGRGVGMDIVRTNIESIGGSVDLRSELGRGTTLTVKIPLTLAIIPALIVASGGERFAIPQVSLLELVRLEDEAARRSIEWVHGYPVYRLRGNLLPLVALNHELQLEAQSSDGSSSIVVLQTDGRQFGLVVDQIYDTEEIVVKPLGCQIKSIHCFSGATILGDGHVALIIDVWGLAKKAGFRAEKLDRSQAGSQQKDEQAETTHSWLLFRVGKQGRMALPLSTVSRLEKLEIGKVERSGYQEVVQYRGQIMPLLRISEYLSREYAPAQQDVLQVVVYPDRGRNIGLVVDEILDIVHGHSLLEEKRGQRGIAGCAVIQDRVTDLFDVGAIAQGIGQDQGVEVMQ